MFLYHSTPPKQIYHTPGMSETDPKPGSGSGPLSILDSLRQIPTADAIKAEHQISLVDQERGTEPVEDAERNDSEAPTAPSTPGPSPLTKKITSNSQQLQQTVKREWTKRKYAKYDRDRYDVDSTPAPPDEDSAAQPQLGEAATTQQTSFLERSQAKAKSFLKRKRTLGRGKDEQDTIVEILYENQRGMFLFGVPKYSSSSLLPSDPKPWQNAQFRTSPVDIRNAQVPDPSWEWAWKSWYVDMSRDVDEEGWEYSLQFTGGWSWHGNHPWFHSFVRRRRWLRMRRRRHVTHHTKERAHELTAEYFTIHPKTLRPASEDFSKANSSEMVRLREKMEEEPEDVDKMDISDIGSLIRALKRSAVDREKIVAVRKFADDGGEEVFYLSERMEEIMNLFIFQSSRRQLLADLLQRFDEVHKRQDDLKEHQHDDDTAQKDHDTAAKRAENLINAVHAADEQVKKLEFWSDIKDMAQSGKTLQESEGGNWDKARWQGLTSPTSPEQDHPMDVFKSKQSASEKARELHDHPEHAPSEKGKAASKKSSVWFDTKQSTKESSEETGAYSTAAESASELARRGSQKGKAPRALDGADEEPNEFVLASETNAATGTASAQAHLPDLPASDRRKQNVQIIEPVPEPAEGVAPGASSRGEGDGS